MCDPGAHAGADVQTQDVQSESPRLSEDVSVPEVAEDGRSSRSGGSASVCVSNLFISIFSDRCRMVHHREKSSEP